MENFARDVERWRSARNEPKPVSNAANQSKPRLTWHPRRDADTDQARDLRAGFRAAIHTSVIRSPR